MRPEIRFTATTSKAADDALDVVAQNLPVTLGVALAKPHVPTYLCVDYFGRFLDGFISNYLDFLCVHDDVFTISVRETVALVQLADLLIFTADFTIFLYHILFSASLLLCGGIARLRCRWSM